ncbi:hypothetical protein G3I59_20910 [Amycolatopsis rubida]|uniref:Thioester reductase (TE) domain-containing protein n=1 Tax=Amycolatopsis rubida TaxID=112413 RepID=A0ABX0BQT1_9PSEU|nr:MULTISPECIES: SDR family oxidoreductase [Amycolatopsis]MYW93007.1 hypothetical protein [Amycolatopsis rubida]NEC57994.1 hypothetical protein [Amycolatopsis rubida]OAP25533.1 Linear gramicidin synthase subunit D [Amycolatopsis sp. M39]
MHARSPDDGSAAKTGDWPAGSGLFSSLRFAAPPIPEGRTPKRVLLTCATSLLGSFLLDRLVRAGVAEVRCLIRARDAAHGLSKLAERVRGHGLDFGAVEGNVVPLAGDLSQPRLGLSPDAYDELARTTEMIVHNGSFDAGPALASPRAETVVSGVRALIALAASERLKPLHHISTLLTIAGSGTAHLRYILEDDRPSPLGTDRPGTADSRRAAEDLVREASSRGLPAAIYRPHAIAAAAEGVLRSGDTPIGAWTRAIVDTGAAPEADLPLDFAPADYAADVIVHVLRTQPPDGRVYTITHPAAGELSALVDRLRNRGYSIRDIPYDRWAQDVSALIQSPGHPARQLAPLISETGTATGQMRPHWFFPEFSCTNTIRATANAGLDPPPAGTAYLDGLLDRFARSGLLPPPSAVRQRPSDAATVVAPGERSARLLSALTPRISRFVRETSAYRRSCTHGLALEDLRRFVAGELPAQLTEIAAFERMAAEFGSSPAGDLFRKMTQAARTVRPVLREAAAELEVDPAQPVPQGAVDFGCFMTELSHRARPGAAAAVLRTNLLLWCAVSAELLLTLRGLASTPAAIVRYLEQFEHPPVDILSTCADVLVAAVELGEDGDDIAAAVRRAEAALRGYFKTVVGDPVH